MHRHSLRRNRLRIMQASPTRLVLYRPSVCLSALRQPSMAASQVTKGPCPDPTTVERTVRMEAKPERNPHALNGLVMNVVSRRYVCLGLLFDCGFPLLTIHRHIQLRCDVIQAPVYTSCSRCRRLKLDCKIDSTFKRIGKRSRNQEMEKRIQEMENEIQELRRQLANQPSSPSAPPSSVKAPPSDAASPKISSIPSQLDQYINSEQAVSSLLDLRSGVDGASQLRSPNGQLRPSRRLEGITLSHDQIQDLFYR